MKRIKLFLSFFLVVFFASCFEVNEEIVINENGTGTYQTKMEMGQLLEMIQSMAGEEELKKEGMDRVIDTTIFMRTLLDSAKDATPEQKDLLKDGKLHLAMNMKEKVFNAEVNLPFKKLENLQLLMSGNGNSSTGITQLFKNVFNKPDRKEEVIDGPKEPGLDDINNIYDVTISNGVISKKLNEGRYKAMLERPEMEQMKQMSSTGMEILYSTTTKLPRPVKKSDNPLIKLSDDKKTVTLKYNLVDLFSTPEKYSYRIEY